MKKKILAVLLVICLAAALLPMTAMAATKRTEELDLTGQTTNASSTAEGWSWNASTGTLTLNNFTAEIQSEGYGVDAIELPVGATVILKGTNRITTDTPSSDYGGIYFNSSYTVGDGETCTIKGGGKLIQEGGGSMLYAEGPMEISNVTLEMTYSEDFGSGYTIYDNGYEGDSITLSSVNLTVNGDNQYQNAIQNDAYNADIIIRNSKITVKDVDDTVYPSDGGCLIMDGSTVNVTDSCFGPYAWNGTQITNCRINCTNVEYPVYLYEKHGEYVYNESSEYGYDFEEYEDASDYIRATITGSTLNFKQCCEPEITGVDVTNSKIISTNVLLGLCAYDSTFKDCYLKLDAVYDIESDLYDWGEWYKAGIGFVAQDYSGNPTVLDNVWGSVNGEKSSFFAEEYNDLTLDPIVFENINIYTNLGTVEPYTRTVENGFFNSDYAANVLTLPGVGTDCAVKSILNTAFNDVPKNSWYTDPVNFAVLNNLFSGTSDTTFEPGTTMTRGMVVTVLYSLEGKPDVSEVSNPFTDVKDSQWYANAVKWAYQNGIVSGISKNKFGPNDAVTREQLALILKGYADNMFYEEAGRAKISGYKDAGKVSSWAREAMEWAVYCGIISGKDGNRLAPGDGATRAEVAAMMRAFCNKFLPAPKPTLAAGDFDCAACEFDGAVENLPGGNHAPEEAHGK